MNNKLLPCSIIIGFLIIYICYSTSNKESFLYNPPNIEELKNDIQQLKNEELKNEENENEEDEELCKYNTKYELSRNENILKPQQFVNIYDSNFGGLLGTTLGTK